MDISVYCGRIQELCDKLSNASIKIEDHVIACFLLAGLVADANYSTYLRETRNDNDLTARAVKSDPLLEERRVDAAADSSEKGSAVATRRQWKPKSQQNIDGAKPKNTDPHDQRCYKCGKWGHILYQYQEEKNQREKKRQEDNKKEKRSETNRGPRDLSRH